MAEKGAHLSQTAQIRISIFDFIAQDALNSILYPLGKKIVDTLGHRNVVFLKISNWFDEYFLLCYCLLQWHYLKKFGATFSEKFYGLQRQPLHNSTSNVLGPREILFSLLAVAFFPYLTSKLNKFAKYLLSDKIPTTHQKQKLFLMNLYIQCNSSFNILYQSAKLIQHLRFLSGKSEINSPLLWAAGVRLKYAENESINDPFTLRNFIANSLQRSLEITAFFIQFFQSWQTEKAESLGVAPVPPPPEKNEKAVQYKGKCPICLKKISGAETVLATSGFVFCFICITSYLQKHGCCPVTKLPANVDNLIRIYSE